MRQPNPNAAPRPAGCLGWYLHAADAADRTLTPDRPRAPIGLPNPVSPVPAFTTFDQALEWFDVERANLLAATRQAAEAELDDIAWKIPVAMSLYFYIRKPWADWVASPEVGLTAARRRHDPFGEAAMLTGLGAANYEFRLYEPAVEHLRQAHTLWRDIRHRWSEAITLNILGSAYRDLRRFEPAITCFRQALSIWPEIDHSWGKGSTLHNLGTTYRDLGQPEQAIGLLHEAIAFRQALPDPYGEAWAVHDLGVVYADIHRFDEAVDCFDRALAVRRDIGDRHGEAQTRYELGKILQRTGSPGAAAEQLRQALTIFGDLHDPRAHDIRAHLQRDTRT